LTRVALFSIDSRSSCFPLQLPKRFGFTLAASEPVSWSRTSRLRSRARSGFTQIASLSAPQSSWLPPRSPAPRFYPRGRELRRKARSATQRRDLARFYPRRTVAPHCETSLLNSIRGGCLGFTRAASRHWTAKFVLLFQLEPPVSVLPAPFVSELTREVFLLDQSVRILRAAQKSRKRFL